MRGIDTVDSQNTVPMWKCKILEGIALNSEREMLNMFMVGFYIECSGCLEYTAWTAGGSRYYSDM